MLFDKVRFVTDEKVEYGKFVLYFGSVNNSVSKKWYFLNDDKELLEMKEFESEKIKSYRIPSSINSVASRHFYKKKMNNLRVEHKSVISALVKKTL